MFLGWGIQVSYLISQIFNRHTIDREFLSLNAICGSGYCHRLEAYGAGG